MDTILNYSVVTTGLLFGVIVLAIAALWVYWSKFFIPFSTYCWWRDRIPRIVMVYCFVSFGAWAFFYGRERNADPVFCIIASVLLVIICLRYFFVFMKRRMEAVDNALVCVSDAFALYFLAQCMVLLFLDGLLATVEIAGSQLLLVGTSILLVRNLRLRQLVKGDVYVFAPLRIGTDDYVYGKLIINECSQLDARVKKLARRCYGLYGKEAEIRVTVTSFHPFRLCEV